MMKATPFGRYVLLQKLAIGGTAEIFKAKLLGVEGFEKEVVIKRILAPWSANPHFISMLIDEAKILVRLQDEKIVQVYELGKEEDLYYISMEYVKGWDLRHILRDSKESSKPFQISECIYVIREILKGLEYIHKQTDKHGHNLEIVHRDISPQNILISTEGKIKIADFGIAHARSRSYETSTGVIKGKFAYMSPEQARGEALDFKTDLFATGILFYELLSRQKLFQGKADLEVLDQVRNFEVKKALQNLMAPDALKEILLKALASKPVERYSSAQEFLKDLQKAALALSENKGEEIFLERLQTLPQPEEKKEALPFLFNKNLDPFPTNPIVSREWSSDTSLEITHSLEKGFGIQTDRNPSFTPIARKKNNKIIPVFLTLSFMGILFFLFSHFYFKKSSGVTKVTFIPEAIKTNEPIPLPSLPESKPFAQIPEIKTPSLTPPKADLPKGVLSVRATPWGKISVSSIASNVEKPLLRSIPYGNYRINVSYQSDQGAWSSVSKSVKIAKASTVCSASFQKDGRGFINCQ